MMKKYFSLILTVWTLASCSDSSYMVSFEDNIQTFTFTVGQYADLLPADPSRAASTQITQLVVGIYNANGGLVSNVIMTQSADFSKISIEGLDDGNYTAVFIGVAEQRSGIKPVLELPHLIQDAWLLSTAQGLPHNNEYLYANSSFTIKDNKGVSSAITLKRAVGRVDIEPKFTDGQWTRGSIESLLITFDDGSVYTTQNADGTYEGKNGISATEIVDYFNIFTLPTVDEGAKHGSLSITGRQGDGTKYKVFYEFDLIVQANKRATIRPSYALANDQFGTVRVYDKDRNALNSKLFFQDPKDGYHHYMLIPQHSFKMNGLLKLTYTNNNKQLKAQFYSLLPVKNVTVYAKRPSDVEFFEIAWFESLRALEERTINLSSSPDNRVYRTESGEAIFVDKMINDLEYKYVSTDAHMKKIASLKWPCHVSFIQPTADTLKNSIKNMPFRAVYAREAVALWTNLAFLYSHPLWEQEMLKAEKKEPFMEYGQPVSIKDKFMPQVFNKWADNFIILNILQHEDAATAGEASVGTGIRLGLRPNVVYTHHYVQDQDTYQDVFNVGLHEYGHTLGYGHNGDFTYGKCKTVNAACMRALVTQLPYPSSTLLNSTQSPYLYLSP